MEAEARGQRAARIIRKWILQKGNLGTDTIDISFGSERPVTAPLIRRATWLV